jgi:hypothetical protein
VSLYTYFDKIFCVTLPQRAELFNKLQKKIKNLGGELTPYRVFPLNLMTDTEKVKYDYYDITMPSNWKGRNAQSYNYMMCFFNIIQKCKDEGVKSLLYLEDDVCILPHFKYFMPIIMENAPKYWEMIYFGPGHHGKNDQPSKQYNIETPYLYRSELNLGMQAVAISERFYDMILEIRDKPWLHENPYIDITLAHQFHRGNSPHGRRYCYGAFPYLVCETSGFSYNEYNSVQRPEYELWKKQIEV